MRSNVTFAVALTSLATLFVPPAAPSPQPLAWSTDYAATRTVMAQAGYGDLARDRTFLAFDPTGDGRIVEVVGDLSKADRVVVLVPGSDTTLANFDQGLGGVARRSPAVQARTLAAAIADERVAVVAWLGYDPPEGLGWAAVGEGRAAAGAVELTRFLSTLPGRATVVVVGHSYGTVVVGLAAKDFGPQVTDIVALASPGLGADTVADLDTDARVWLGTAADDWINRVPNLRIVGLGHGSLPADARPIPTDGVAGHDSYLTPGASTLKALAAIALTR